MGINLRSVFVAFRKVGLRMMSLGEGSVIVNVASGAGLRSGREISAHYAASKAGVVMLTWSC